MTVESSDQAPDRAPGASPGAARVVAALCVAFVVSQFYRSSNAVIAPDLMRDVGLTPAALGILTGAFFVTFGLLQLPIGVLLDRLGPRLTIASTLVLAVAGALVFATAETMAGLAVGRVLMGAGCASVFIGALVVCARWYPPARLAAAAGILLGVGGLGNILSTTPLALVAGSVGWRGAFLGMAAVTALAVVVVFAVVRDAPPGHAFHSRQRETLGAAFAGVREVLGDRRMRLVLIMAFVGYPTTATIHGLWGGPYLHDALGLDGVGRGNVLLAMAGGLIVGMLGVGSLDRIFDTRKRLVTFGALTTAALLTVLALAPTPTPVVAALLFGALGVIGAYVVVILAHGRAFFPERLVGRALTAINFAAFMGVAAMQVATGFIVGAFPTSEGAAPEIAYRSVFGFLALMIAIAVAIYSRVEDRRPSDGIPD